MIKFFRKIRQKLLMENKTAKYFKYAIGEIILVVIGIVIALQINNSNELRKDKNEEALILSDLKEDLTATRLNFIETIKNQEKMILSSRDLINAIEAKDYSIHPDTIRKYIPPKLIVACLFIKNRFNNKTTISSIRNDVFEICCSII